MNKAIAFICAAASLASASAMAAPSTELKVNGTLKPAACSLQLGNNGYVTYGLIASSTISKTSNTKLPTKSAAFVINCDLPTRISLTFSDNRLSSKVTGLYRYSDASYSGYQMDAAMYGLGAVAGKNIGAFQLGFANVKQDGQDNYMLQSGPGGAGGWGTDSINLIRNDSHYGWGRYGPASLKTITGELTVTPVLEKGQNLPAGEEINFDGSITVELNYL